MYIYYASVESEDHYLYASEVAQYLHTNNGLATVTGKPAIKMLAAIMDELDGDTKLYYFTKYGPKRVYKSSLDIIEAAKDSRNIPYFLMGEPGHVYTINVRGKKYKYVLLEKTKEKAA